MQDPDSPSPAAADLIARRRVQLSGAVNFRDLGGLSIRPGFRVAWKRIYRSDSLCKLTPEDLDAVAALGLRSICDFRSDEERQQRPNRLPAGSTAKLHTIGFMPGDSNELWRALNAGELGAVAAEEQMRIYNREFALGRTAEYRRMLEILLEPDALPALIHCASGKDRTGFGIAVVLLALGASRETILADYLLSDLYRRDISHFLQVDINPSTLDRLRQAHPSYLGAAFDAIDAAWGSTAQYLAEGLHLTQAERLRLQELLIEADPPHR